MIKRTCPLGSTCKKTDTEGNVIERCNWLVGLQGQNPQTGEPENKEECAVAWTPILAIQSVASTNGIQAATESFRNEMVKSNQESSLLMARALMASQAQQRLIKDI